MSVHDAKAVLARAYASGKLPRLDSVSPDGINELWVLDGIVFFLPVVPADASPQLEFALRLRREASLTGSCDQCGASFDIVPIDEPDAPGIASELFVHRVNCPAADENIMPIMRAHYASHTATGDLDEINAASRRTKEKLARNLPDAAVSEVTDEIASKAEAILEGKLASVSKSCGHLESKPVQTWHIALFDDTWRCDECLLRFSLSLQKGSHRLTPLEDNTCDYCRRYVLTKLRPAITRIGTYVLHGAMCRRCEKEWATQVKKAKVEQ